jgi:hypothetical protein
MRIDRVLLRPGVAETQCSACDTDSRHHPTRHKLNGILQLTMPLRPRG